MDTYAYAAKQCFINTNSNSNALNICSLNAILPLNTGNRPSIKQDLKSLNIVRTHPNLQKTPPLMHEMQRNREIETILIHTSQHYNEKLSDIFFRQINIPPPHINLEVDSDSHTSQTAEILKRIEPI